MKNASYFTLKALFVLFLIIIEIFVIFEMYVCFLIHFRPITPFILSSKIYLQHCISLTVKLREKYHTENDLSYYRESIYLQPVISKLRKPITLFGLFETFFKGRYSKYFPVSLTIFFRLIYIYIYKIQNIWNPSNVWCPASLQKKLILETEDDLKGRRLKYLRSSPPFVSCKFASYLRNTFS